MVASALKHLIEGIVKFPKEVNVDSVVRGNIEILTISVNPDDVGIVVGKGGKTIQDLRNVATALSGQGYVRLNIAE